MTNLYDTLSKERSTSVSREAIEKLLPELLQSQAIKQIEDDPPIYVRANRYQARIGYQHYKGWTFSIADAHKLLDILEQGRYKSIREIAQVIGQIQTVGLNLSGSTGIIRGGRSQAVHLCGYLPPKRAQDRQKSTRKVSWVN